MGLTLSMRIDGEERAIPHLAGEAAKIVLRREARLSGRTKRRSLAPVSKDEQPLNDADVILSVAKDLSPEILRSSTSE